MIYTSLVDAEAAQQAHYEKVRQELCTEDTCEYWNTTKYIYDIREHGGKFEYVEDGVYTLPLIIEDSI